MAFFDDVMDRLFPKKESGQAELVHELLTRSEKELVDFNHWVNSDLGEDLIKDLENAYYLKKSDIESQLKVHLLNTDYSNGFAVSYSDQISISAFKHLFDHLKNSTLSLNYRLAQNDRRIFDKGTYEESIEKWYLKPKRESKVDNLINQAYGNVLIEYIETDRKPSYIKLMVNVYQDRLYTKALPFDDFINELFN